MRLYDLMAAASLRVYAQIVEQRRNYDEENEHSYACIGKKPHGRNGNGHGYPFLVPDAILSQTGI
jgi:hypothetical protein